MPRTLRTYVVLLPSGTWVEMTTDREVAEELCQRLPDARLERWTFTGKGYPVGDTLSKREPLEVAVP
jgi:hypothetical protein